MQFPSGVGIVAIASAVVATFGAYRLLSSANIRTGARRHAHHILSLGAALATINTIIGLIGVVLMAGRWDHYQPQRLILANLIALGLALSGLVLCAGLARLHGTADTPAAALRLLLDGLVIASAIWFVGWVLLAEPTRLLDTMPAACPALQLAAAAAALSAGVTSAVTLRSARPGWGTFALTCGVQMAVVGGLGLAAGICQAGVAVAVAGGAGLAAGLLLAALAIRAIDDPGEHQFDIIRRGTAYAFWPMLAMAVSGGYHLLADGRFTPWAVTAWTVVGFALVSRQYLALRDVRGIARRLAEREAHFRELAHTDSLTGLANRRGLLHAMQPATAGRSCVLLCLDLDGFKNVNDMRGHDVGDEVLREVAQRLQANLRPGDLAARLGGDEFAILMWAHPPQAQQAADHLLSLLNRPYRQEERPIFLSVSIGLAGCASANTIDELLRNADLALRFAKQRGKNRVEHYDLASDQLLRRRITLEQEMRGAVERGEMRLAFQPVVAIPSVRPVGAEALLRWTHPALGNVRPDEFIPIAEECGMIASLGAWVLHEACYQLSRWLADGHDVWVSVNVSPRELHSPDYVLQVAGALRAYRVPPQRLVLEVTEHAVATDLDELIRRLTALRATGVRVALDDFGAGYSSLGQLRKLPIDILKIDHSLVAEPDRRWSAGQGVAPMVDVVMRLGHRLGLEVIAEGVTNQAEFVAVVDAGCRFAQGQLFGWGVPAEHLEALLDSASMQGSQATPGIRMVPGMRTGMRTTPASHAVAGPLVVPAPDGSPAGGAVSNGVGVSRPVIPAPRRHPEGGAMTSRAHDVRSVDSSHEMRQA